MKLISSSLRGASEWLRLSRSNVFILSLFAVYLLPFVTPNVGASWTFTFTVSLTLILWLTLRWGKLRALSPKTGPIDITAGVIMVGGNFARNILTQGSFGLVDQLLTLLALSIAFYGFRRVRFFLLPAVYILILIAGYQLEDNLPQLTGLETWQAGIMAFLMSIIGVKTAVVGNVVTIASGSIPISLEIAGPCTGIKGMLAFGTLASMAVLDVKVSRGTLALVLGIGFLGAFLVNLLRLFSVFLAAYYVGADVALNVHTYLGYSLFLTWVVVFWGIAFRYLIPRNRGLSPSLHAE